MIINIEGIPGSGKTTMTTNLAKTWKIQPVYEPVADNPFLDKFYDDPRRHAFTMQMWLLSRRHAANSAAFWLSKAGVNVVVDRGRLGDRCFARVNAAIGNMTADELDVYEQLFGAMDARDPDVIVFLDLSEDEAVKRIDARGRECEKAIDVDYLTHLRNQHLLMVEDARARGVNVLVNPDLDLVADVCGLKKV